MRTIVFELCAETIESCMAARIGGASRIELCSGLSEGGVTPSHALILQAVRRSGLPVHVMIRPRNGGYVYSASEFAVMATDIRHSASLGAAGVVLGLLALDGSVDVEATRRLVGVAGPMEVTFHRAFDGTPSLPQALENVIETGCRRVLTSGGRKSALDGAEDLSALVAQAAGRIEIAVGGGLRLHNASALARITGATHFHGSLQARRRRSQSQKVSPESVRKIVERLREA